MQIILNKDRNAGSRSSGNWQPKASSSPITMSISASESSPESFMGRPLSGRSRPKVVLAISRILAVMASSLQVVVVLMMAIVLRMVSDG